MTAMRIRRHRRAKALGVVIWVRRVVRGWVDEHPDAFVLPSCPPEPFHVFEVGDLAVRASDDIQRVTWVSEGGSLATFECVKAPVSGWCAVGDVETNLTRRYQPQNEKAQRANAEPFSSLLGSEQPRF